MKKKIKILLATLSLASIMIFGNIMTAHSYGLDVIFYYGVDCEGPSMMIEESELDIYMMPPMTSHMYDGGIRCYNH